MNEDVPLGIQIGILAGLLLLSAFFSSTETALMSLNRYRLRHRARSGHRGALFAEKLLERPDRIIGLILLGNNLVNILAASLTTLIAIRLWGDHAVAAAALVLTLVVLIFAEVIPKTAASMRPEGIALSASYIYFPMLKVLQPVVWVLNTISNGLLWMLGFRGHDLHHHHLTKEELRVVLTEAGTRIPKKRQQMMTRILDLENVTVEDIMVPKGDIVSIDLSDNWNDILRQIQESPYTRLPFHEDDVENLKGILHLRSVIRDLVNGELDKTTLMKRLIEPYYVHEGTSLNRQLFYFQQAKKRMALVVDEYGDIQGLVTLEDILEEIVGEFTSDPADLGRDVTPERNGSYIVSGGANVRDINRLMQWELPIDGAKTLSGLVIEYLEAIPDPGTGLVLAGYPIEVLNVSDNTIKSVRVHANRRQVRSEDD